MEPNEHEKDSVQNEHDHLPDRQRLQSHAPAQNTRGSPAVVNASDDHRQDSGNMDRFATEIRKIRREQREHCLNRRIIQTLLHLRRQPAYYEANTDTATGYEKKLQNRLA